MHRGRAVSKTLSPAQAAQVSRKSRRTVLRAIDSGAIKAHRDNRNHWKIDAKSLSEWADAQGAHIAHAHPENTSAQIQIAQLETRVEMLAEQLEQVKADRDVWRETVKKLTRPKPNLWASIFSKINR